MTVTINAEKSNPKLLIDSMLAGELLERIRATFLNDQYHSFILFANQGGHLRICSVIMRDDEERARFARWLGDCIKSRIVCEFALVCESWIGEGYEALEHKATFGSIADFQARKEAVTVFYSRPDCNRFLSAEIKRSEGKPADLDLWQEIKGMTGSFSPFSGLFREYQPMQG